jgi:hypothetical protein
LDAAPVGLAVGDPFRLPLPCGQALEPDPLMPLPPNPPDEPEEPPEEPPMPLAPLEPELEDTPALPRVPAEVEPALRLAVLDELGGADAMLLPADDALTSLATDADFAVAALTRADASAADLFVAATPPPVPDDWPDTAERDASRAVLREAACEDATVDGVELLGVGGGE